MSIYIYGVGQLAKFVAGKCEQLGIRVLGFVDNMGENSDNLRTSDLPRGAEVWVCVLNNFANIESIYKSCMDSGARSVLLPPKVFETLGSLGVVTDWYWLTTDSTLLKIHSSKAQNLLGSKLDPESKNVLDGILNYRLASDFSQIVRSADNRQYLDTGIESFWENPSCFVDCGSYIGDTIEALFSEGHSFREVIAFEPDRQNFRKLQTVARSLPGDIKCFPTAISNEFKIVNFSNEGSSGSKVIEGEGSTVALSLDGALPNTFISHVKMDLEGGELDALIGMRQALIRDKPNLAIAVYHKPDDLWKIPEFIFELNVYNTFSLRTYAEQGFETILYCSAK